MQKPNSLLLGSPAAKKTRGLDTSMKSETSESMSPLRNSDMGSGSSLSTCDTLDVEKDGVNGEKKSKTSKEIIKESIEREASEGSKAKECDVDAKESDADAGCESKGLQTTKKVLNAIKFNHRISKSSLLHHFDKVKTEDPLGFTLTGRDVLNFLEESGLQSDDPRMKADFLQLQNWDVITDDKATILLKNSMIRRALRQDLTIKDFKSFTDKFKEVFHEAGKNQGGNNCMSIPQLASQPNYWGAAVCSVDGQRFGMGDVDVPFCVQSSSKPVTYCAAVEMNGESKVHQHVGREPSGRNSNDLCLMKQAGKPSIPHNPYTNAGAIMTASLVKMESNEWDRYQYVMGLWKKLSGGKQPSYQNDTFMSERATASRNFCLAYMMEEEKAFPRGTDLHKTLEAYFTWCSIEVTSKSMATLAATLANGGICPLTNERIFTHQTVTRCLSLMMSCGMYDYSGRFAFEMGFPTKSSVSGVLCIVIPGVCGIATFSPRIDHLGNSVRGLDFCARLSQRFQFHVFSQEQETSLIEQHEDEYGLHKLTSSLWWSAATGDTQRIRQLAVRGMNMSTSDYDSRSPLHLAASEGHESMVKLLISLEAEINAKDHLGNTPMMDAIREHRNAAKRVLQLASRGTASKSVTPDTQDMEPRKSSKDKMSHSMKERNLFNYFKGNSAFIDGEESVPLRILVEVLDNCGISTDSDPRWAMLGNVPDPFTKQDLDDAASQEPLLERTLAGDLVVPNFPLFCQKLEELFSQMTLELSENHTSDHQRSLSDDDIGTDQEVLNIMTVDGQRLHLGPDTYLCAGDLISVALFAVSMELLGLDSVKEFVGLEPSGVKSSTMILNSEGLPFNAFMWNGVLALCSLLEEKFDDAIAIIAEYWAKLCGTTTGDCPMQYDEAFEEEDMRKNGYRINALLYTSLDLQKFPANTPPNSVMSIFFRLRAIKTRTTDLGSIAAVFANSGVHPMTNVPVFQPDTVKSVLSMMYSSGCEAKSGELSFKVGVPAKSSCEGAVLIVLPKVMGLCVVAKEVEENGVSLGGLKFCSDFGNEFNCHVLGGSSTSSAKEDVSLYHFQTDMELCNQLLFAAESGDVMTLAQLHQLGFSLDYADYDERSAAHVAAASGQIKVLKYLHYRGADMQVTDRWGGRPIDDANKKGHHRAAAVLQDMQQERDLDGMFDRSDTESCVSASSSNRSRGKKSRSHRRRECPVAAQGGERKGSTCDVIKEGDEEWLKNLDAEENEAKENWEMV